LLGNVVTQ